MIKYHIQDHAYESLQNGFFFRAGGEDFDDFDVPAESAVGDLVACMAKEEVNNSISVYTHIQTRWNGGMTNKRRNTTYIPINIGQKVVLLGRGSFSLGTIDYQFNTLETIAGRVELFDHKSDVICTVIKGTFHANSQEQLERMLQDYAGVANQFYAHLMDPRNSEENVSHDLMVTKSQAQIAKHPAYKEETPDRELIFRESARDPMITDCIKTIHDTNPLEEARRPRRDRRQDVQSRYEEDSLSAASPNTPNKSRFSLLEEVAWEKIGGFQGQKDQVKTFVDNWLDPESARYAGIDPKKTGGMIFLGPSGWGKSMFADAAGTYAYRNVEGGILYMFRSYGDFATIFRGGEATKLKEDFDLMRRFNEGGRKIVYFFEEIQSAGERDESPSKCGNELLNQLLVELTQIDYGMTLVMAATARDPSRIDPQLLRPGRLGEHVYLGPQISSEDAADIVRAIIDKNQKFAVRHGNTRYVSEQGIDYAQIGPQITDLSPAQIDKAVKEALNPKMLKYRQEKVWVPFSTQDIIAGAKAIRARKALATADLDNI